jgi:hypothetical protein
MPRVDHQLESRQVSVVLAKWVEVVTKMPIAYFYTFHEYFDARPDAPVAGMLYEDTPIRNCSVSFISVQQTLDNAQDEVFRYSLKGLTAVQVGVTCNTTANQFFVLQTSGNVNSYAVSLNLVRRHNQQLLSIVSNEPLNITTASLFWFQIAGAVLDFIAPNGERSILLPSLITNNLSSIGIDYSGLSQGNLPSDFSRSGKWLCKHTCRWKLEH